MKPFHYRTRSTFQDFVPTSAAAKALRLSVALATQRSGSPRLVLFYGPPGSGKSHLLRAIAHTAEQSNPRCLVFRTSAMDLVQDLVSASRAGDSPEANWSRWPHDLVTIDDLHTLAGKPITQSAVGHGFGVALARGCRVACAVGRLEEIPQLVDLVHQLPRAGIVELLPPTPTDIRRILRAMPMASLFSARDVGSLATACGGDVRRAEGALNRRRFEAVYSKGLTTL